MDNKDLEEKIAGMDLNSIYNTSPKAIKELTNDFSEPLVRLLMMKAMTISEQKGLLKFIKKTYGIWQKRTKILWSEHPMVGGYPEYFDTMEANIESDRIITTSGSVPVGSIEYYQLISQQKERKFSETDSNSIVNAAIAAVKAEIPHFEYDQQNEALSIVYGKDKGKVNLDEVIEKKTKDVVNKQLEENTCTDDDIDEIFANENGQDLGEKSSKETAEDEQFDEDEDTEDIEENEDDEEYEDEDEDEVSPKVREYDTTYDFIFDPRVKPQAVKEALDNITTFDKCQHPFWFVFMKVLVHLHWIPISTYTKDVLKWASLQYELNWKTKKQLSFSDIGGDKRDMNRESNEGKQKKIKDTDITLWNTISKTEFRDIEKYRKFALLLKKTFIHFVVDGLEVKVVTDFNLGKPRDRVKFMKSPKNLINSGK